MQNQSFRRATSADVGTIVEITRAAYASWVPVIGREPKPMTANYRQAVTGHVIDLLEEDGRPIALIEVITKPSHLLIENVAVLPDRHGEGIGGLLLARADEIARSRLDSDQRRALRRTVEPLVGRVSFHRRNAVSASCFKSGPIGHYLVSRERFLVHRFGLPIKLFLGIISTSSGSARSVFRACRWKYQKTPRQTTTLSGCRCAQTLRAKPHICLGMPRPCAIKGAR